MKSIAIMLIRVYKAAISPYMPGQCRFEPSCSEYAADAIRYHGVVSGTAMAGRRLMRCRPGVEGGHDPAVPEQHDAAPEPSQARAAATEIGANR